MVWSPGGHTSLWCERFLNNLFFYIKNLTCQQCHLFGRKICHFNIVQLFIIFVFISIASIVLEKITFWSFLQTFGHSVHLISHWVCSFKHDLRHQGRHLEWPLSWIQFNLLHIISVIWLILIFCRYAYVWNLDIPQKWVTKNVVFRCHDL